MRPIDSGYVKPVRTTGLSVKHYHRIHKYPGPATSPQSRFMARTIRKTSKTGLLVGGLIALGRAYPCDPVSAPGTCESATPPVIMDNAKDYGGPVLRTNRWRNLFYGYDSLSYRLVRKGGSFWLAVAADYGDRARRYFYARISDSASRPLADYQHQKVRCQLFNTLVSACLIRDRFHVPLTKAELIEAQSTGIRITFSTDAQDHETIVIPAAYVQAFLNVQN